MFDLGWERLFKLWYLSNDVCVAFTDFFFLDWHLPTWTDNPIISIFLMVVFNFKQREGAIWLKFIKLSFIHNAVLMITYKFAAIT